MRGKPLWVIELEICVSLLHNNVEKYATLTWHKNGWSQVVSHPSNVR